MYFELGMRKAAVGSLLMLTLALSACGGGGGSTAAASSSASSSAASVASSSSTSVASSSALSLASSSVASAAGSSASSVSSSAASSSSSIAASASSSSAAAAPASASLYNVDGYAALNTAVTGAGVIAETASTYKKIYTPTDFANALTGIKTGTTKVMEIMTDLDLGYTEIGTAVTSITSLIRANATAKLHPKLIATGTSLVDIQKANGLTIFSRNGSTLRHVELNIKDSTNVIIRNLKFDEMWEWDEATKGNYDSNDWDYITLGDGTAATKIWIDHCTFYKTYDGIVDIKGGSSGITISWSQILGGDGSGGAFIKQQMDALETSRPTMYNYLRGFLTQDQITQVASTVKKGHLIGATELAADNASLQVTLHHNYYKDLQDRMPRLRGGDVQVFNIFADSSNANVIKTWFDAAVVANPTLSGKLTDSGPTYHFGITSNGTISTESGVIEVDNSLYVGVLTPLRNNQKDVTNATYTGSIIARNTQHELLAGDMPIASQQSTYSALGQTWAVWKGNSSDSLSTLGPTQATPVFLSYKNAPPAIKVLHQPGELRTVLRDGTEPAGAGKITMTVAQWLNSNNP